MHESYGNPDELHVTDLGLNTDPHFFLFFSERANFYYLEGERYALLCGNRTDAR